MMDYYNNSGLKRILQPAQMKNSLRSEICEPENESFQGRPRAKRLFNAGDERREQRRAAGIQNFPVTSTIRAKASKSLVCAAKDVCPESTTCVSSFSHNQG